MIKVEIPTLAETRERGILLITYLRLLPMELQRACLLLHRRYSRKSEYSSEQVDGDGYERHPRSLNLPGS